jgi:hypothetical protein
MLGDDALFDPGDDAFGLAEPAMGHQPARALGNEPTGVDDPERQHAADQERQPPAEAPGDGPGVQQDHRAQRRHRRAQPIAAVDDEVSDAAPAGRDQLLHGRVHCRHLAPDAGAGQEAEGRKRPEIPGKPTRQRRRAIEPDGDGEEPLAPEAIGQPPEGQGPQDRARQIDAGGEPDLLAREPEPGPFGDRARERADQRHLQAVQHPGHAERRHDQRMEPAPGQPVEPGGDIGGEDPWRLADCRCHLGVEPSLYGQHASSPSVPRTRQ